MTDRPSLHTTPSGKNDGSAEPVHPDQVEALFEVAGRRPRLPESEVAPIRQAARNVWRHQIRRRTRRRHLAGGLILAAGMALLVGLVRPRPAPPTTQWLAQLELQTGPVDLGAAPAAAGQPTMVASGGVITTGVGGSAALRMGSGPSLRMDVDSKIRIEGADVVALHRGAVYVDSVTASAESSALAIVTPVATVRHLGTQFEARLVTNADGGGAVALRVRVREGAVLVERTGATHEVPAGSELLVHADGAVERTAIPAHGSSWEWTQRAAPALDIEGITLATFLAWEAREIGLPWRYATAGLEPAAREIVLHGSIAGLTPEQALSVVLPGCAMRHQRLEAALLLKRASEASSLPPS